MSTTVLVASIVLVVVVTIGLNLLVSYFRRSSGVDDFDLKDQSAFIKWLQTYVSWYTKSVGWISLTLHVCRILPIFIGFAVAFVTAIDPMEFPQWLPQKLIIIFLTGLSTACVALITQFSLPELEKAREAGRIACAGLVARAQLFFSIERQPDEVLKEKTEIKDNLFKIEDQQSTLFHDLTNKGRRGDAS